MNLVTNFFNESIQRGSSKTRFISNTNNLKVNGALFDVSFVNGSGDNVTKDWSFLKNVFVTISLRLGTGNGSAVNLISSCSLYQLLAYSDYIAGVSMQSTDFAEDSTIRISGCIPIGYFAMGSRDSLDAIVNISNVDELPFNGFNLSIGSVYQSELPSTVMTYQSTKPTGAMQNYTNVVSLFYDGDEVVNKEVNIIDQLGNNQNINIEDAIALSNAQGRFEFFTRFGRLFQDPFDLSQNLSFKCPTDNPEAEILIVGYHFDDGLLISNATESEANRNNLVASIKEHDSAKYDYLVSRGLISQ